MWQALMKDCGYYFDVPNLDDELEMRLKLQRKYDGLFKPGWHPPLTSRRDLMTWACNQYNTAQLEANPDHQSFDCENYRALISIFGPDYNRLKPKLGYIRGLFD